MISRSMVIFLNSVAATGPRVISLYYFDKQLET